MKGLGESVSHGAATVHRPKGFWDHVRLSIPRPVLAKAVGAYHGETIRKVLALEGKPGEWAKTEIIDPGDGTLSLSEHVYDALGEGSLWNPIVAMASARMARRQSYVAELRDPKYDDLEHSRVSVFFGRCRDRSMAELIDALEGAARDAGIEVRLGRP